MRLKAGNPLWPALTARPPDNPPLPGDLHCQVLVIGAGITGAMIAWHLARAGVDVAVVDRRLPVNGSTPASTALIQYELDRPLVELRGLIGPEKADNVYRRCGRALNDIVRVIATLDDDADLTARPSLYLAREIADLDLLRHEAHARHQTGLPAHFLPAHRLWKEFQIDRPGAILSQAAMELDPYRLTIALLSAAKRHGTRIYTANIRPENMATRGICFQTDAGLRITAQHVVFATGYEIPFDLQARLRALKSTYAIATEPVQPSLLWPQRALIWECSHPYLYLRTTPDNRIVAGGEDEEIADPDARDALISEKTRILCRKVRELFPRLNPVPQFRWAGTFAETPDGLPCIGEPGEYPGCFFALGYGGNGILFSLISAQILLAQLDGHDDPDAEPFSFDRMKWRASKHCLQEAG